MLFNALCFDINFNKIFYCSEFKITAMTIFENKNNFFFQKVNLF